MSYDKLPPSPFGAGTTYDGREQRVVTPNQPIAPRIARGAGSIALEHARVQTENQQELEEEAHMERLFVFPDSHDDRMHMRTSVTKESLEDALDTIIAADEDVKAVIARLTEGRRIAYRDMAETIRNDDALRLGLGKYLVDKLNRMQYLPSRLNNDSEIKRPNVQGYDEPMTSKEYASLLAISMLDGTYKDSPGDKIYFDKYKEVRNGQHRYAAQEVLGIGRIARNREYQ